MVDMANNRHAEINSSVTDSLHSVHGVVYVYFMEESEFPGFLGILAHAQTVCTRLSFPLRKSTWV